MQPWYEVATNGDGLSPESVNVWKVPPTVAYAHPNTFQDPTKWNGDHVLNGGNKEWAEEDAALHAYNMENWRNKILQTQLNRQKQQYLLMNVGGPAGGALKSNVGEALRLQQAPIQARQASSQGRQAPATKAAPAPATTIQTQDLGNQLLKVFKAASKGRSRTDKELVKLEKGNQRLLRRLLRRLRHRCDKGNDKMHSACRYKSSLRNQGKR